MICNLCDNNFNTFRGLGIHIKETHKITVKEYYDKFLKRPYENICPVCNNPTTFRSLSYGYNHHCSKQCISKDKKVKLQKVQTCMNNWGVTNCFHSPNGRKQYYKIGTSKTKIINRSIEKLEKQCNTIKNLKYIDENTYEFDCLLCNTHRTQEHYITIHRIYGNINPCLNCYPYGTPQSTGEKELLNYIKEIYNGTIIENDYKTISPYELDINLPQINIAFEFDGTYWHMDSRFYTATDLLKQKHKTAQEIWKKDELKIKLCLDKNIKLIRIKEYDWKNDNLNTKNNIKNIIESSLVKSCEV